MISKEDVLMILDIWCNEMNHFSRVSEEDLEKLYKKFKTRKKNYLSKKFPNGGTPKGSIFEYHMFKELGG